MSSSFPSQLRIAVRDSWQQEAQRNGVGNAASLLIRKLWTFVRESTPEQRRRRYGDMEYDWENRVNTTSATVGWRARLLGLFHSPYQPTEPTLFHEMMASLPIDFNEFIFVDLGSGKGRTLLMASEYPFQKIVGVELIEELHRAAEENIRVYRGQGQKCGKIEALWGDAAEYLFPDAPLVLYLFNPLPESALRQVMKNLDQSLAESPRSVWIAYHNPAMDSVLSVSQSLVKAGGTYQYSIYRPKV